MGGGSHLEAGYVDAELPKSIHLPEHHLGIHHRARANQAGGFGIEDAGGDQVQLQHPVVHHDRVAGVHSALVAHHDIGRPAQKIGDLALSFVAPLSTDDDNVGQEHRGRTPPVSRSWEPLRRRGRSSKEGPFVKGRPLATGPAQAPRVTLVSAL